MDRNSFKIAATLLVALVSHGASAQFCPQNFDGATAPALPDGWSASTDGAGTGWATVADAESQPNAAFASDPGAIGNSYLVSPTATLDASNAMISFRHSYQIENTYDGGVLEISLDGAAFNDIRNVGVFEEGSYNGTISASNSSPIAGLPAWTGNSGGYVSTVVALPVVPGHTARLRWRLASDESVGATGWWIDSIVCGASSPAISASGWGFAAPHPTPILDQATTVMGDTLYTFGGVSGGTDIADAYRFDGEQWTPIGALPVALEYPVAVNDGVHIFILGGSDSDGNAATTLYRYTPGTNTYETMAPFTTAVWATAAVVVDGKIVKFTGKVGSVETDVTEVYDIASNTWSTGGSYPSAASFVSAFSRNGYAYGAGGIGAQSTSDSGTYRYDLTTNTWDTAPIPDLPDTRWGAATIQTATGVMLAGGYVGGAASVNISTSVVVWDGASNTWHDAGRLALARARMTGALFRGAPIVIGGRSLGGGFSGTYDVQIYDRIFAGGFDPD